jgi:CHAT domain-containing protein/tetratricopeptide (TPR) repeat protein
MNAARAAVCLMLALLTAQAAEPPLPERIDAAMSAGDYRAARPLAEALLAELRQQPDKKLEIARVMHVLGSIRDRLGDHAEALEILTEAAGIFERSGTLEELSACQDEAGRAALAAGHCTAAERWLLSALGARSGVMAAHSRSALAEVRLRMGEVRKARAQWELALTEAGDDAAAQCFALRGLGLHAHTTGSWESAVANFRAAREAAASLGPDAAATMAALDGQIGQSLLRAGRKAEAAVLLESAASWFETRGGSPAETAAAWNNLAASWMDGGQPAKAADRLARMLEAPEAAAFAASPGAITLWLNLAAARQRDGKPAADALASAAGLAAKHLPDVHPLRIQIALTAATLAHDAGDGATAEHRAAEASNLALEWMRQAAAWPDDSRLLEFHATLDPVSPLAALAPENAEAIVAASLASQGAVTEILLTRRRWELIAGEDAVSAWRRDPEHHAGPPERRVHGVEALRASLPPEALFLNFLRWRPYAGRGVWNSEGRYGALIVRRGAPARMVDLGPATVIEHRVRRLIAACRDAVAAGGESADRTSIAWQLSSLYGLLWAPLGMASGQETPRMILRADALLHFVPWAVLSDTAGVPLCEKLPQLEVVVFPRAATTATASPRWRVLASADSPAGNLPRFSEPLPALLSAPLLQSLEEMPDLPGVAAEVAAIRAAAGQGITVETPAANEIAFTSGSPPPAVIHFAGHGFVCEEDTPQGSAELRAGLVMKDCAAGLRDLAAGRAWPAPSDGLLFVNDAAALPMDGVEAVVLSGCQTGLGHWESGGQLTGLRHAFLVAGAGTVASTLWDLNDAAAPELVRAIYAELASGIPAAAVWGAQRKWLQSAAAQKLTPGMRAALAGAWIAESAGWRP